MRIRECYRCTSPGEGYLFSVRDYANEPRTNPHLILYGVRATDGGRYYAGSIDRLLELMREAGYENVHRVDEPFFQPAVVGTRRQEGPTPAVTTCHPVEALLDQSS